MRLILYNWTGRREGISEQTIKAENMGRVDSMTKVPPPDNNDAGCQCLHLCPRPPSGGRGRIMCVAHPSAQNHLSTCHFPFAFKGPFQADAWALKLPLRKTVILPRDSNSLSLPLSSIAQINENVCTCFFFYRAMLKQILHI